MPIENGQPVSVEYATDAQFQAWIQAQGVSVDENGVTDWSFDDRCGVIMYALERGITLEFAQERKAAQEGA